MLSLGAMCLLVTLAGVGCGTQYTTGTVDTSGEVNIPNAPAAPVASSADAANVTVVRGRSFCQQDHVLGNLDFSVELRNTGAAPATDLSVAPIRYFDDGSKDDSVGDVMVGIRVPANGTKMAWRSYDASPSRQLVRCTARVIAQGASDRDFRIPVRHHD